MKKVIGVLSLVVFSLNVYAQETKVEGSTELTYSIVEEMPEYPGGKDSLMTFIGENLIYPKSAAEAGIEGTVFITFIIKKDGSVANAKVLRGIGPACDAESLRVIGLSPKWKPGLQRGKPVSVQFNLPIRFALSKDENELKKKRK